MGNGTERNFKGVNQDVQISLKLVLVVHLNGIIPETCAHLNRWFETPSRPCATASKQTMQNVVMATVQFSRQH